MFSIKNIIISSLVAVLVIAGGFLYYVAAIKKAPETSKVPVEQTTQTTETTSGTSEVEFQAESDPQVETTPAGSFTVCEIRCGDGVCQAGQEAQKEEYMGVCVEDVSECPQDCKK